MSPNNHYLPLRWRVADVHAIRRIYHLKYFPYSLYHLDLAGIQYEAPFQSMSFKRRHVRKVWKLAIP